MVRMLALVVRRSSRNLDHFHCTEINQDPQGAVNGCYAQSGGIIPGRLPYLGWGEGAGGIIEGFLDSLALSGRVVHFLLLVGFPQGAGCSPSAVSKALPIIFVAH